MLICDKDINFFPISNTNKKLLPIFLKIRRSFFISIANWKKVYIFVPRMMFKNSIMALEIKAIPTLYGKEARRFRKMAEESERKYDLRIKKDITADPRYKSMLTILSNSPIFNK